MPRPIPEIALRDKGQVARGFTEDARAQQQSVNIAVGALIISWANTESAFIAVLERLLGCSSRNARAVHAGIVSNRGRMELLKTLAKINLGLHHRETLLKLIYRFKAPTKLRNELAHSVYALDSETYEYIGIDVMTSDYILKPTRKPFNRARMNEIKNTFDGIDNLNREIWQFCRSLDEKRAQELPEEGH